MKYFPVFLDLKGKLCVVVGGGGVGERKARNLLKAGALVKVIGPKLTPFLTRLRQKKKIVHLPRSYRKGDLRGAFLTIAATDSRTTNERVFRHALEGRILVNIVDDPAHSSFIVPSIVDKRDLLVAISTSGRSPALARMLRRRLEKEIGPEYNLLLKLLAAIRKKIFSLGLGQGQNRRIFRQLMEEDLHVLIREKKFRELDGRLKATLGEGFSLDGLDLNWKI